MAIASDGGPRVASRRPLPRALAVTRAALYTLLPLLFLVGFAAAVFFPELTGGPIFYGRDTTSFYYPLTAWAADEIKAGRLPLWLPQIFGGYPLMADGEIGLLSPLQWLVLSTLDMPLAYGAGRVLAYALSGIGLYLYAQALGANRLGSTIGALAFAYSSFMVGHLQHDNIIRSAIWLPWLLLTAEYSLRTGGARRLAWMALAALILALTAVGVHIQPLLMSLLLFGAALLFGPFGKTSIPTVLSPSVSRAAAVGKLVYDFKLLLSRRNLSGNPLDWLLGRAFLGVTIVLLGLGLAAVQLVPLYQLGLRSLRPSLVTYDYATSFAVSPAQLLTLVFPSMFNFDAVRHWALWAPHETTLYVGVAPLVLALLGLAFVRGRAVIFFGLVALVSLLLAFGDYLPIKPYTVVWNLPGFSYLRAPARFSLLLSLALAMLAALGTTWLMRRARYRGSMPAVVALLNALLVIPAVLGLAIGGLRWWLRFDPATATDVFRVLLDTSRENWQLGPWHIYYGLLQFTRPDNERTALGLVLLVATPLLLRLWLARPHLEWLCGGLLLLLTAGDLWVFTTSFYLRSYPEELTPATPAVLLLQERPEPFRIFVEPGLNERYGANQLAGVGIQTVNGYSSLEPPRFADYWWSVVFQDNALLDQFDVQYVLARFSSPGSRIFDGVRYHPYDRLMSGTAANPTGEEAFRVLPMQPTSVTVVGAIEGLGEAPSGSTVAELTLVGLDGSRQVVPLRAGIDIAEYNAAEPGWPMADYVGPRVVWAGTRLVPGRPEPGEPFRLYGATIPLLQPVDTVAVEVRTVTPVGRLHLYGLGIRAADGTEFSVRPLDKLKYVPIQQDDRSVLLQNVAARPRVSVVSGVIPAAGPVTADLLHALAWNPSNQAVVEGLPQESVQAGSGLEQAGTAQLLEYSPTQILAQADLPAPGYLILADRYDDGWKAYVDEVSTPIARANGIERLVAVPAGSHVVRFTYEPFPLQLGAGLSVVAGVAWVGLLVLALARATGLDRWGGRLAGRRR
ncbi:MAG: hypothetical protein AB7K36_01860 [Chloroflexota bacterium]